MAKNKGDEDDFATVYSRLVGVFRKQISFTIVFPLAQRLLKDIPPRTLDVYASLSEWSFYKRGDPTTHWLEDGMNILQQATEEQYRIREIQTETEITRREKTIIRQEIADAAMKRYSKEEDRVKTSVDELERRMQEAKEKAVKEAAEKWEENERKRIQAAEEEKERLLRAKEKYAQGRINITSDIGISYWGILIGGTAVAAGIIAIVKGYHYI